MAFFILCAWILCSAPNELIHFSARAEKNNIQIKWEVSPSTPYKAFTLEASSDNVNYKAIREEVSKTTETTYAIQLENVADGEHYYRLKLYENTTDFEYSEPIYLEIGNGRVVEIPTGAKWRSESYQYEK